MPVTQGIRTLAVGCALAAPVAVQADVPVFSPDLPLRAEIVGWKSCPDATTLTFELHNDGDTPLSVGDRPPHRPDTPAPAFRGGRIYTSFLPIIDDEPGAVVVVTSHHRYSRTKRCIPGDADCFGRMTWLPVSPGSSLRLTVPIERPQTPARSMHALEVRLEATLWARMGDADAVPQRVSDRRTLSVSYEDDCAVGP